MNEFLRNFVMNTIRKMIDDYVDEWQVRQYALGWYEKTVLTQDDLVEIETRYAEKEKQEEIEIQEEIPSEEVIEE